MTRLTVMFAAAASLALSACGFQPLYAENTGVASELSGIAVETEEGRPAYMVGQALRDRLGSWSGPQTDYVLRTRVDLSRTGQAASLENIATQVLLVATVAYGLYDLESGELLTQGVVSGVSTYDVPIAPYAAIRSEQDSEQRAARLAADRVVLDLARYFRDPPPAQPLPANDPSLQGPALVDPDAILID